MKLKRHFDRLLGRFGLVRSARLRNFQAAKMNRLTADWIAQTLSANQELKGSIQRLRARSRDLANNNDYVSKFCQLVEDNAVGPNGITLQARIEFKNGKLDQKTNRAIEDAWQAWGRKENASGTRSLSWRDLQVLAAVSWAIEGEAFIHVLRGFENPFGFAVQFIDPDQVDHNFTGKYGGNAVHMGVEVDRYWAPVAYHILTTHPSEGIPHERLRVPADQILHLFKRRRYNQTRGVPLLVSAILRLRQLGQYEEAELIASRISASKMAIMTTQTGDEYEGEEKDDGTVEVTIGPGEFAELPAGHDIKPLSWDHPTTAYEFFSKSQVRAAAAGMGVAYASLSEDYSEANFSSTRQSLLSERDRWRSVQTALIDHLCRPVFNTWLPTAALLKDAVPIQYDPAMLEMISWQARGWGWVDPLKDMQAAILALKNGLTNATAILAAQGLDPEDVWQGRKKELDFLKELGLTFEIGLSKGDTAGTNSESPDKSGKGNGTDGGTD